MEIQQSMSVRHFFNSLFQSGDAQAHTYVFFMQAYCVHLDLHLSILFASYRGCQQLHVYIELNTRKNLAWHTR